MNTHASTESVNRRQFLTSGIIGAASLCLGCSYFLSLARAQDVKTNKSFQAKISENSAMSFEQVFNFAFRDSLVPTLVAVSQQVGREKFVEMLKSATDQVWLQKDLLKHLYANMPKGFWSHVLNLEVLEDSPNLRVYKVTKCLWAKSFREADAADIGYAMWCYGDYAIAKSDKENLERNTTLMQGHDYCLLKYTKKA